MKLFMKYQWLLYVIGWFFFQLLARDERTKDPRGQAKRHGERLC